MNPSGTLAIHSVPGFDKHEGSFASLSGSGSGEGMGIIIRPQAVDVTYYMTALVLAEAGDPVIAGATLDVSYAGSELQAIASYTKTIAVQEANIDNKSSAIGEAILAYPVYGSGSDCTESAIIGTIYLKVYRARITSQPGFDTSYKSASTFAFTLSAMDAKRTDEAVYSIAYVRK